MGKTDQIVALNLKGEISEGCLKTFVGVVKRCLLYEPKKRLTMTRAVAQLELALEQQEKKGRTAPSLLQQFWPYRNRVIIPSGSIEKDENEVEVDELANATTHFPLADIWKITDGFSSKRMIYHGFGARNVFHGVLKSGQDALIIKLNNELPDYRFKALVSKVSRLEHENVLKLVGYCLDGDLQVLVQEFTPRPRGSLHDILHGRQGIKGLDMEPCPSLSWAQRLKIAVGIAAGLCYIHDKDLIHDNIISNNVLLFDDEIAKITNLHPSAQCSCEYAYFGECYPIGYDRSCSANHPPEYGWSDRTQKGDVYSFGVLMLELLIDEEVFDRTRRVLQRDIVSWARPQLGSDRLHEIVDLGFKANYPPEEVERMAEVAASCLEDTAEYRPDMRVVLKELMGILPKQQ